MPLWGGPTGLDGEGAQAGDEVLSYGNSELRLGVGRSALRRASAWATDGSGWSHTVYTATPGIPGDSRSAFMNGKGEALGVLSTVAIAPLAAGNGVGDPRAYLDAHGFSVSLANGTEPFPGPLLPG